MNFIDTGRFYLRRGACLGNDKVALISGAYDLDENDIPNTFVFVSNSGGGWFPKLYEWSSNIICSVDDIKIICVVGEDGDYAILDYEGEELMSGNIEGFHPRSIFSVGDCVIVFGLNGLSYYLDERLSWIERKLLLPSDFSPECVCGNKINDFYTGGWGGELVWTYNESLKIIDTPTNLIITGMSILEDGRVFCCCQSGVVLIGYEENWESIINGEVPENFWSISYFQDMVYLACMTSLYRFDPFNGDSVLEKITFDNEVFTTFNYLENSGDKYLLSVGSSDVCKFDGSDWERII